MDVDGMLLETNSGTISARLRISFGDRDQEERERETKAKSKSMRSAIPPALRLFWSFTVCPSLSVIDE